MTRTAEPVEVAKRLVAMLGGRFSEELDIDVDKGDHEIERWFLAAALFGTRISAAVAMNTYRVLAAAGVSTVREVAGHKWDDLVRLLDTGGYARYDFRTATRLIALANTVTERYPDGFVELRAICEPVRLVAELDRLPGWGPVTIQLFLRELRGVWSGAQPPVDQHAVWAAMHLRLAAAGAPITVKMLSELANRAGVDLRDLESALVRASLKHRHDASCTGGSNCRLFSSK